MLYSKQVIQLTPAAAEAVHKQYYGHQAAETHDHSSNEIRQIMSRSTKSQSEKGGSRINKQLSIQDQRHIEENDSIIAARQQFNLKQPGGCPAPAAFPAPDSRLNRA